MKNYLLLVAASATVLLLAGCADDMSRHHDHFNGARADNGVDLYYDGAYGTVVNGYWGADGSFYYRDAADHPFQRDMEHHFSRSRGLGYKMQHFYRDGVH